MNMPNKTTIAQKLGRKQARGILAQRSCAQSVNDPNLQGVTDERIFHSYVTIISRVTAVCQATFGKTIPILFHGHDFPVPDG
jgi:hypothetical protein